MSCQTLLWEDGHESEGREDWGAGSRQERPELRDHVFRHFWDQTYFSVCILFSENEFAQSCIFILWPLTGANSENNNCPYSKRCHQHHDVFHPWSQTTLSAQMSSWGNPLLDSEKCGFGAWEFVWLPGSGYAQELWRKRSFCWLVEYLNMNGYH